MHFEFIAELMADFHLVDLCKFSDVHLIHSTQSSEDLRELLLLLLWLRWLYVLLEESLEVDDVLVVVVELSPSLADLA